LTVKVPDYNIYIYIYIYMGDISSATNKTINLLLIKKKKTLYIIGTLTLLRTVPLENMYFGIFF